MTAVRRPVVTPDPGQFRLDGPSPAGEVAKDIIRRALPLLPVGIVVGALIDGAAGAGSVLYGMLLVLVNFAIAAGVLAWASKISFAVVASAAMGGYAFRLGLIFVAVYLVKDMTWMRMVPLGITIIVTHLGLLVWELRYVSASMAYPGLKPTA